MPASTSTISSMTDPADDTLLHLGLYTNVNADVPQCHGTVKNTQTHTVHKMADSH